VILIDANLLLYAHNSSARQHKAARRWLEEVLSSTAPVRLAWVTILAFLRISTSARVFPSPLSIGEAIACVADWLEQPAVDVLEPGERHFALLSSLLPAAQAQGAIVMDGHLAALAIEHGAILYTTDRDFARFAGLRIINPLES
jgi:uncharacterized protein